jgi:hypothetical protein
VSRRAKYSLTAFLIAAACTTAGGAAAHPGNWYWSDASANDAVRHSPWAAKWGLLFADCSGRGTWMWSRGSVRQHLYKHFDCILTYSGYDDQYKRLHVLGQDRWVLTDV